MLNVNVMNKAIETGIVGFSANRTYAMVKLNISGNVLDTVLATVYVPLAGVASLLGKDADDVVKGDKFTIPERWTTVTRTDENGDVMSFKDGVSMRFLTFEKA